MLIIFPATERLIRFLLGQVFALIVTIVLAAILVVLTSESDDSLWVRGLAVTAAATYLYSVIYLCLCPRSGVCGYRTRLIRDNLLLLIPWLIYVSVTGTFSTAGFLQITAFVVVPLVLVCTISEDRLNQWNWQDLLAILCIWLPFEAVLLGDVWLWPEGGGAYPVNTLLAFCLVYGLFVRGRNLPEIGLPLRRPSRNQVLMLLLVFLAFCAFAIPFGLFTGFIAWAPQKSLLSWGASWIGVFLFIALPEELLFRGLIMNYFSHRLRQLPFIGPAYLSLILTSVFFGLTHMNNPPHMDWRFFIVSSAAGFCYGFVWMTSRNLLLPALLHTMTNYVWLNFFLGGANGN